MKMFPKNRYRWIFLAVALALVVDAAEAASDVELATANSDPSLKEVEDIPGLPRVLLIGDSISMGYTQAVRNRLKDKANVHRPQQNGGDTATGVKMIEKWLGARPWDVIHFNFGLHDLKYLDENGNYVPPDQGRQVASLEQYERNLRTIVALLRRTGAKLIFATTTPVPAGSKGRVKDDELRYNEVALRVMAELGVPIDDLHAVVAPEQGLLQLPKNVHFTPAGYERLGDAVAASIAPLLPSPLR